MAQIAVCNGYIRWNSGMTEPFNCFASPRGGDPIPFTYVDYTPSTVDTSGVFDMIFVIALFIAFCAGFHKGGQR